MTAHRVWRGRGVRLCRDSVIVCEWHSGNVLAVCLHLSALLCTSCKSCVCQHEREHLGLASPLHILLTHPLLLEAVEVCLKLLVAAEQLQVD